MSSETSETPKQPIKITAESRGNSTVQAMFDKNMPQENVPDLVMARLLRNVKNEVAAGDNATTPAQPATPPAEESSEPAKVIKLTEFKR